MAHKSSYSGKASGKVSSGMRGTKQGHMMAKKEMAKMHKNRK